MPGIYYVFAAPPCTGGDYIAVEHIATLNRLGFNAKAFYCSRNDGWRQFKVPVALPGPPLGSEDVFIAGEDQSLIFAGLRNAPCIKVMNNQNPYYTFDGFPTIEELNNYPFVHIVVLSDFCGNTLRELGVRHPMTRVHPALPGYFEPKEKKLQIAFSPRKRPIEAGFLQPYFKSRVPEYAHVPWVPLMNMSRDALAPILAESAIYAGLPWMESLGLMNLEAMASGCHVVGYTGHGGTEYSTSENGDWIPDGDYAGFAEKLREACRMFESGKENSKVTAGLATAATYSQENFELDLMNAWKTILGESLSGYRL
jgi:hypothetical protein